MSIDRTCKVQDSEMTTAILELLWSRGPCFTTDIHSSFGMSAARISRRLSEMTERGILEMRIGGSYNARTYSITEKGVTLLAHLEAVRSIDPSANTDPVTLLGRDRIEKLEAIAGTPLALLPTSAEPPQCSYRT